MLSKGSFGSIVVSVGGNNMSDYVRYMGKYVECGRVERGPAEQDPRNNERSMKGNIN
jgi:hypothetical protein